MSLPEVSIILPVWNGARYLADAIESIIGQTFAAFELLVIDDGSTDDSRAIAEEHARLDPRVIVLAREHGGIVSALNAGIEVARGRYLARMDADDISVPSRLEKQLAFLEAHPACVAVGSNIDVVDESGESVGIVAFPRQHEEIELALLTGRGSALAHPAVVMRSDAVRRAGGYRAEHFPCEDFGLWLRLAEAGELANLDEPLLRYRRHRDSVGVRERQRQSVIGSGLINDARARKGMKPLQPAATTAASASATYHLDCARIALKAGKRVAAIRHARGGITAAPLRIEPYAMLAACLLPRAAVTRLYSFLRGLR